MTRSVVRRRALLLVAALATAVGPVVVGGATPASAADPFSCASGAPCVHITFPDGGHAPVDVPPSVIDANVDVSGETYEIRQADGTETAEQVTGLSLRALLSSVIPDPVDPDSVTSVSAQNPSTGYESPLQQGDLADPSPFENGLEPAFAVSGRDQAGNDTGIEYIRPLRNEQDVNSRDRFQTGSLATTINLQVNLAGGLLFHPSVTVTGNGPFHPGDAVPFTVSFAGGDPSAGGATYNWTYAVGDPPAPGSQTSTHTYPAKGTYTVSVAVSKPAGGDLVYYGQSPGVTVRIGPVPAPSHGGTPGGGGQASKHHPKQGPSKAPGHHAGSRPSGGPTAGSSVTATPGGTTGSSPAAGADQPPAPQPTGPVTAPPSERPSTSPSSSATRSGGAADGFVSGILIDGPVTAPAGNPASDATRAAASARRPARLSSPFDAQWLWLLVPVPLLVTGAVGERRRVPAPHRRQSRR